MKQYAEFIGKLKEYSKSDKPSASLLFHFKKLEGSLGTDREGGVVSLGRGGRGGEEAKEGGGGEEEESEGGVGKAEEGDFAGTVGEGLISCSFCPRFSLFLFLFCKVCVLRLLTKGCVWASYVINCSSIIPCRSNKLAVMHEPRHQPLFIRTLFNRNVFCNNCSKGRVKFVPIILHKNLPSGMHL